MGDSTELADRQRRTLDRLKPLADQLDLYLAGGTAIALHLHHRVSRDLDLFSKSPRLNLERIRGDVAELPNVHVISMTDATLHVLLDGIPVDFVRYPYPLLRDTAAGPGQFPVASLEDLATMKLSAIARRGIRRDFWDLHEIACSGRVEHWRATSTASG